MSTLNNPFAPFDPALAAAFESNIQMALAEAKQKAKKEVETVLAATGLTLEQCRAYVDARPELKKSTYVVPRYPGLTGSAANMIKHISELMTA